MTKPVDQETEKILRALPPEQQRLVILEIYAGKEIVAALESVQKNPLTDQEAAAILDTPF